MGTLRNAVKRRTHKERPQPAGRRRLGLLEKKKDYRRRADDYHKKEKAIQTLRRKAEERNPDEFYFAMHRAQTKRGIHELPAAEANKYSQEELRLMKSQDASYLSLKASVEAKKLDKLRGSLHFLAAPVPATQRHTFFVDSTEEAVQLSPAERLDTPAELLHRRSNRPRTEQLAQVQSLQGAAPPRQSLADAVARRQAGAYRELQERSERHDKLQRLAQRTVLTRHLQGRGTKTKQVVANPDTGAQTASFVWKQVRQK